MNADVNISYSTIVPVCITCISIPKCGQSDYGLRSRRGRSTILFPTCGYCGPPTIPHPGSSNGPPTIPHPGSSSGPPTIPHPGSSSGPPTIPHPGSSSGPPTIPHPGSSSGPPTIPHPGSSSGPPTIPHPGSSNGMNGSALRPPECDTYPPAIDVEHQVLIEHC